LTLVACLLALGLAAEDHLKFGRPACDGPVLDKKFFVVCHDGEHKIPKWVAYALTPEDLTAPVADRDNIRFKADPELPPAQRAALADYTNSGYDKGHMAPAADFKRSEEAMRATFVLSNAVPQRHGVNAGAWAKLEAAVRGLADSRNTVWVFTGPVFVGKRPLKTIGKSKVAVPSHTFKAILCLRPDGEKEMFAYVLPNLDKAKSTLVDYAFSVNYVERLTALDFFDGLPAEEQSGLERRVRRMPGE
jgi:endonuclease G